MCVRPACCVASIGWQIQNKSLSAPVYGRRFVSSHFLIFIRLLYYWAESGVREGVRRGVRLAHGAFGFRVVFGLKAALPWVRAGVAEGCTYLSLCNRFLCVRGARVVCIGLQVQLRPQLFISFFGRGEGGALETTLDPFCHFDGLDPSVVSGSIRW